MNLDKMLEKGDDVQTESVLKKFDDVILGIVNYFG
jgi:hypothetical protein